MNTLLNRLSDDNPKDQKDFSESDDKSRGLIDEILFLLSSRPRSYNVENIPAINCTILNYGVDDVFASDIPQIERNIIMQSRIQLALQRFEPRLRNVSITIDENGSQCFFIINADTDKAKVRFRLMWDDVINQFFLHD
ncbi:GPW/gp25 family protein (plasmid) [Hafnia alvei]|uniref:GPW/gp25 family protein n=1 Tax=Hafnia alvei TaxID=569 RepID=UPI000B75DC48|nr:GPW/gp25 family protein [Hafnia alvei]MBI0278604.1 GPW/gp25 family protein [Hafnia alvei]PNL03899.1 hypothetical protein CEQ28_000385 [Hafnia alvei]